MTVVFNLPRGEKKGTYSIKKLLLFSVTGSWEYLRDWVYLRCWEIFSIWRGKIRRVNLLNLLKEELFLSGNNLGENKIHIIKLLCQ